MKVRCIKLFDARGAPQSTSSWLTIDKVYDVLTLEFDRNGQWLVRVVGDGKSGVALFPFESFVVASPTLPLSWIAWWNIEGSFQLAPERWTKPDFWERFYDREPDAVSIFEEEKQSIESSSQGRESE